MTIGVSVVARDSTGKHEKRQKRMEGQVLGSLTIMVRTSATLLWSIIPSLTLLGMIGQPSSRSIRWFAKGERQ
jgi:hypothetical protein